MILGCLVRRPLYTANVTVASLTRVIDHYGPTLLIDEAKNVREGPDGFSKENSLSVAELRF
jgi:hypothetical protein